MFECYYALCVCVVKERPIMFVYSLSIAGPSARPALPAAAASPALRSDPVERRRTLCASRPWSLGSFAGLHNSQRWHVQLVGARRRLRFGC